MKSGSKDLDRNINITHYILNCTQINSDKQLTLHCWKIQGSDVLYRNRFPSLSEILISQGSSPADLLKYSYYTGCYCMLCARAYMRFFELALIQHCFSMLLCWKFQSQMTNNKQAQILSRLQLCKQNKRSLLEDVSDFPNTLH